MIKNKFVIIIVLLLGSISISAQQPNCSESNLRASVAEAQLEAERVKNAALRSQLGDSQGELKNKNSQIVYVTNNLNDIRSKLSIEQDNSAALATANQLAQQKIEVLERQLLGVTAERNFALFKIKKANETFFCQTFHIGCVSLKD